MKKILTIAAAIILAASAVWGQQLQQLPNDPETRTGKLSNGLTYFIRHNDKPAQRAEFYLATNAGALQETPDQDGLAHFLEHMCFNGTKNFPGKGILNWLESIGASFGGNVNASTGVERTVYLLNNIPLVRPTVVDTCLLIMHDYSHFVTCDPKEIDAERGVILEEKRTRNTAQWRTWEKTSKYLYGDTKYANTTIIGSEENLKTFKPESLTNFYHSWYHPGNQALIVVGDINVDEVEQKIKTTFADIPLEENPKQKEKIRIPDNKEPIIGIITDPEASSAHFEIYWKEEARPKELNSTAAGLMMDLIQDIFSNVVGERFADIAAKPDAPFIYAGLGFYNLCNVMDAAACESSFKEGQAAVALETMLTEIRKMSLYGFSDSEIERAKTEIISQYESAANKAGTRKNGEFVWPLINWFFRNNSYMTPADKFETVKAIMAQLSPAIINKVAQEAISNENMVVVYSGPEHEGAGTPTEEQIRSIIEKVGKAEIARPAGDDIPSSFLNAAALKGSKIGKTGKSLYESEVFTLKNGVKVYLLPTDYEKDKIFFQIYRKGGKNILSPEDLHQIDDNIWTLYLRNTGIAGFSATTVSKMLSGKQVSVNPFIKEFTHGVSANSTCKDIETAFQLAYLYYTAPRFDETEYSQGIKQIEAVLPNLEKNPNFKFQQEYAKAIYADPERNKLIDNDILSKAKLAGLEGVYRKLYNGVDGATIIVVGDFKAEEMKTLVAKYIGSITKGRKAEPWQDRGKSFRTGGDSREIKVKMETPKATVGQIYTAYLPYTVASDVQCKTLSYILDMVYVETLREEEGGTYGAQNSIDVSDKPNEYRSLEVFFDTNVEDAAKLAALAKKGIEDIAKNGPTEVMFDKAAKNLAKRIPENKLRNIFWFNALKKYDLTGTDFISEYEKAVSELKPEQVKAAAEEFIKSGNFIQLTMKPLAE